MKEYLVCYDIIKPKEYSIKAKNKDEAKLKADKTMSKTYTFEMKEQVVADNLEQAIEKLKELLDKKFTREMVLVRKYPDYKKYKIVWVDELNREVKISVPTFRVNFIFSLDDVDFVYGNGSVLVIESVNSEVEE